MQRKEYEKDVEPRDASSLKVGIAISRFNGDITEAMLVGARKTLREWNVPDKNVFIAHTFGSFELPHACQRLMKKHRLNAVIAIGCIVKGETSHDAYLAQATMHGLMRVMLDTRTPVGLAVLTTNTLAQARVRARGNTNSGEKAAIAALEAALL